MHFILCFIASIYKLHVDYVDYIHINVMSCIPNDNSVQPNKEYNILLW